MKAGSGFYTLKEASEALNVSLATLKNWERQNIIKIQIYRAKPAISKSSLHRLQQKISTGRLRRLASRANKGASVAQTDPTELLRHKSQAAELKKIKNLAATQELLLAVYLVQLKKRKIRLNRKIKTELAEWGIERNEASFKKLLKKIEDSHFDWSDSLLSYLHQYLSGVGARNREGSYFTPLQVAEDLTESQLHKKGIFYNPCCGSGHFLLAAVRRFSELGLKQPWQYVVGYDRDQLAVLIARAQLTLLSGGRANSCGQIKCCDSLLINENCHYDYIVTNPPWGAELENEKKLISQYGEYSDSFEYFIKACLLRVGQNGRLSLILPAAFLNVSKYKKLRLEITAASENIKVKPLGRIFAGVFTEAIVLELQKGSHQGTQQDNLSLASPEQKKLIKQMEKNAIYALRDHTEWAMGVVSGDNARFVRSKKRKQDTPILRGRDIQAFQCLSPSRYINLQSPQLQQKADVRFYKCKTKLVYRFIGRDLTFAIERKGYATLNSANIILTPSSSIYSTEVLCGILNSEPARAYYRAKFNSLKVLRQHLENFPLPPMSLRQSIKIKNLVRKLENKFSMGLYQQLNALVAELYGLNVSV